MPAVAAAIHRFRIARSVVKIQAPTSMTLSPTICLDYNFVMTIAQQLMILAAGSYFVGAIPFGLIVGRMRGVDIREHGSKNIGATNAGRVLGRKFFWIVFVLDLLKGFFPVLAASMLVGRVPTSERTAFIHLLWVGVGAAAMLGHVFPIYLKFKGGKGVATSLGIVLGLWPFFTLAGLLAAGVFVGVALVSKYVSLSSITAAIAFPIFYVVISLQRGWDVFGSQLPLLLVASAIAVLIVVRHRANISRLLAGTENRIGGKARPSQP